MKKEKEKTCEEKRRDCTMEEPSGRKNMLGGVKKTYVCLGSKPFLGGLECSPSLGSCVKSAPSEVL